ncbi:MAG: hypothetical protein ACXWUG_12915, partial [Polyangiales bacterium]
NKWADLSRRARSNAETRKHGRLHRLMSVRENHSHQCAAPWSPLASRRAHAELPPAPATHVADREI